MNLPKKELGQHWLRDQQLLQAIVEAAAITEQDVVLEIGPGKGTLTAVLQERAKQVIALEFDQDLIEELTEQFKNRDSVAILQGDIRKFNFTELPSDYKIVANIPYYLTSNLIRLLSETPNKPLIAALLVQKEVAERICASAGQMSILSVVAQWYFECSLDILVPAEYFIPPPKVDSQVVVLKRRKEVLQAVDEKKFFQLVKAGFSEKRKTLRNALSGGLRLSKQEVERLLYAADFSENARAQELSLEDWVKLYTTLENTPHELAQ